MKRKSLIGILTAIILVHTVNIMAQEQRKSFEEFRKGILSGYSDFRKTILERYSDFLKGEWHEYESLNGERRDKTPKPAKVPSATPMKQEKNNQPEPPGAPDIPTYVVSPNPESKSPEIIPTKRGEEGLMFYNIPVTLPKKDFQISYSLGSPMDYSNQWKKLAQSNAVEIIPEIKEKASELGLNDYLIYELVKAYISEKFPQADDTSRLSAIHFILANMGYDARIAVTGRGAPLLLLPFRQTIYARNYMMMPDGKYYIFAPEGFDMSRLASEGVKTCTLPSDLPRGEKFDLVLGTLNIPFKPKPFDLQYGSIHLSGTVNENLMPILYHYPQMPIADYAVSNPDPKLREELVRQMRSQLKEKNSDQAVGELLGFMHNVFSYATDEEFHGFEKPYFLEETLYYPKNDCEDRAIFYTYFLWNALGKEAQLISFPGHEAATVRLDNPVPGKSYTDGERVYFISDPTFIGSQTGMVMPVYEKTTPKVDYTYK